MSPPPENGLEVTLDAVGTVAIVVGVLLALVASIGLLSLVPGSVVIEARPEERMIYAHVLGADDDEAVAAFRAQVALLEADLVEALGRPQAAGATTEEIP